MKITLWTLNLIVLTTILMFNYYSYQNESGHTGLPIHYLLYLYGSIATLYIFIYFIKREKKQLILFGFIISILAFLNVYLFIHFDLLVYYDDWAKRL